MNFFVVDRKGQSWTNFENWLVVHLHRIQNRSLPVIASTMHRSELAIKCQLEKLYGVHKDSLVFGNNFAYLSDEEADKIVKQYHMQNIGIPSTIKVHKVEFDKMLFDEAHTLSDKALQLRRHASISETAKLLPNLYIRIGEAIKGLSASDFISLTLETLPDEHWFLIEDYVKCIEKLAGTLYKTERRRQIYLRDCYRQSIRKILASDKGYKPEVLEWLILHKFF